jgi:UDP-galactopyranose mutase
LKNTDIAVVGAKAPADAAKPLLLCFSHLRWDFVFQRPQQVMSRLAEQYRVIFWQEPVRGERDGLERRRLSDWDVEVVTPLFRDAEPDDTALRAALETLLSETGRPAIAWYYTPMMRSFSHHLSPPCTVYDCMDQLANFRFAPPELVSRENELLEAADLVFTGGYSLFDEKRERHPQVFPFPSSVDKDHFAQARSLAAEGGERPLFGFFGVIDERMDLALIDAVCAAHPEWDFELVGPVVKIDPASLPRRANLRFPGSCEYRDLPRTIARWDVALMPFALNEATAFISPTKTPEYLAAGKPVVSTSIRDVVRTYGTLAAVRIADGAEDFAQACAAALSLARGGDRTWLERSDALLADMSWDSTVRAMADKLTAALAPPQGAGALPALPEAKYEWLVVGAGFAGAVMAERLARDAGKKVLVIDRRPHIAGNAFDRPDAAGILIHQYGPHIFHTNSPDVFDYLSQFTDWRPYEHRVLAQVGEQRVPMPINRTTLNRLYGLSLASEEDAERFYAEAAEPIENVATSEDVVVAQVGRHLYETFFRGYTRKQWGLDPSELDKSVTARVPARTNDDDRYFTDRFQAMPAEGYTAMFERMLSHENITVALGIDFADIDRQGFEGVVYTGPIDEFYDYRFGKLPYRSLRFDHRTLDRAQFQEVATVNYPGEDVPWTRITEYKHLTGQDAPQTSITYEYSSATGDPFYPVPRAENQEIYKRYQALALAEPDVLFVGRLATYRYYNMDQVVAQALATYRRLKPQLAERAARPGVEASAPLMAK